MNSTEMMERFRRFVSADLSVITPNRMHQVSEILLETDTVRIILTRYEDSTEEVDVDIEVSLPFLSVTFDAASIKEYIDSVIAIFEYLKCLAFIGFGLEMIQEEGILIAFTTLRADTEESVFKTLGPPD
ncbi:MAG: hypothetical protein ACFFBJ_03390 [Promethearchaeota archaeon]